MRGSGLETVLSAITQTGLVPRGAFLLSDEDRRGALASVRAIVLAGMAGRDGWSAFAASPEAADGADHPLDRWSRRVIEGSGARPRRARPVPLRRTAVLAVPAMGAALGAGASLADRSPDPSALRTLAQLPRSARVSRSARCSRTRGGAKSVRLLPRTLVLEYMPRRRVLRRRLRCRRLRRPSEERERRGLHGRGMPGAAGLPGWRSPRLWPGPGEFHHAGVSAGAGGAVTPRPRHRAASRFVTRGPHAL